jgi:hypothetical protein
MCLHKRLLPGISMRVNIWSLGCVERRVQYWLLERQISSLTEVTYQIPSVIVVCVVLFCKV